VKEWCERAAGGGIDRGPDRLTGVKGEADAVLHVPQAPTHGPDASVMDRRSSESATMAGPGPAELPPKTKTRSWNTAAAWFARRGGFEPYTRAWAQK
jgi:hypothetical protein